MTSRSRHILITCDWFSPDTGGGAERVAYEVGCRIAAAGDRVAVLATRPRGHAPFDVPPGIELTSVPAHDLAGFLHLQVSVAPTLPIAIARTVTASRPDVVWGHSLQFQTTLVAALVARRHRVPFVVTAHIGDLDAIRGPIGVAARIHEATLGRMILRLATRAIAVSEPVATHIRALEPGLTVDVVPNGVDLSRFRPGVGVPHDGLRAGFLGRLVPNKGADVAVLAVAEAANRGVDLTLSIAGEGPERERLEHLAGAAGVRERVRFEGYRSDPEVWLRSIDVLVRPSTTEGMPLGVLEAMATGVAVVASDVPGNASLIRDGETGLLVPVRDHHALARALERLHRDETFRRHLSRIGPEVAAVHTWERTAELSRAALERAVVTRRAGLTLSRIQ